MTRIITFANSSTLIKKIYILTFPLIALLMDLQGLLFALILLISIDLITGIRKSFIKQNVKFKLYSVNSWLVIKSNLLRQSLKKAYEYGMLLVVALIIELLVFEGLNVDISGFNLSLSQLSIVIPCGVEVWSIFENVEEVTNTNLFKKMISFLPEKIQKIFENEKH